MHKFLSDCDSAGLPEDLIYKNVDLQQVKKYLLGAYKGNEECTDSLIKSLNCFCSRNIHKKYQLIQAERIKVFSVTVLFEKFGMLYVNDCQVSVESPTFYQTFTEKSLRSIGNGSQLHKLAGKPATIYLSEFGFDENLLMNEIMASQNV